ncbi:DUF1120 domain-containing protein, partial [Aeromonas sp. 601027]|uniref:DUF1120 domain-containing protein n=1 Tax=unclassified Aeromonas TaxID=257493 RepID=UPI003BA3339A
MAASSSAFAAGPSATLQVQGSVTQGACVPTLANGGVFNIGDKKVDELPSNYTRNVPIRLSIVCSAPTTLTYYIIDNRSDSSDGTTGHGGLGKTSTGINIGVWRHSQALVSGSSNGTDNDLVAVYQRSSGEWAIPGGKDSWFTNMSAVKSFAHASSSSYDPQPIMEAVVDVYPWWKIDKSNLNGISDVENIDGNATFVFNYL